MSKHLSRGSESFYDFIDGYRHEKQFNQFENLGLEFEGHPEAYFGMMAYGVFHDKAISDTLSRRMFMQILGQSYWYKIGKPYVKVYPAMASMLAKTNINIDCKHVVLPFPVYEIKFSMKEPFRAKPEDPPLRGALIMGGFSGITNPQKPMVLEPVVENDNTLIILCDYGESFTENDVDPLNKKGNNYRNKYYHYLKIVLTPGRTITNCVEEAIRLSHESSGKLGIDSFGYTPSEDFQWKIMSVAISTTFFIRDQHELIRPDIPRRYVERFKRAEEMPEGKRKEKEIAEILRQSRKLDHNGWLVGRETEIPRPIYDRSKENSGTGEKRGELQWCHIRGAHSRLQKYGPRSDPDYKLIFLPPTEVRPDLPFKPVQRGYKITDKTLTKNS